MYAVVAIVGAINFFSAFTQAATGFGYAIIAMFLMPYFLPFRQCTLISAAVIVVIAMQMTIRLRHHIRLKKIILPLLFCLSTTWIGIYLIQTLNQSVARKAMGGFLIFLSGYFFVIKKYGITIKESTFNGAAVGAVTGISTGMFNIVGPFLTLYYFDCFETSLEFKANLEFSFLIAGVFSLILNLAYGGIDSFTLLNIVVSNVAVLIAGVLGLQLYYKLDKEKLKLIIISILPVMGIIQILK